MNNEQILKYSKCWVLRFNYNYSLNILEKINPESLKKQNLNLLWAGNHLHGIYIVFPTLILRYYK